MREYERFYREHLPNVKGSGGQLTADCPFCQHKQDFSFNIETGQSHCFQCGFEGDVFSFLQKLEILSFQEAKDKLAEYSITPLSEGEYQPPATKKSLKKTPLGIENAAEIYSKKIPVDLLAKLKARGIARRIAKRYCLGWADKHPTFSKSRNRLTIPVKKKGKYINIRFHSLDGSEPKDLPYKRKLPYATWLFPEDQLENDTIWLCEGELDSLCGISHHLACVSVTGGAGSWRKEFTPLFEDKIVRIVYDCDEAGGRGADKIAGILLEVATEVKVIDLGLGEGEDLTDWFSKHGRSKEELEELARKTPIFEAPVVINKASERLAKQLAAQSITTRELLELELPQDQYWIGGGLVPKNGYVLLAGTTKEGKTILALQIALCLVTGTTLLERFPIEEKAKVLFLYGENTRNGLQAIQRKQVNAAKEEGWQFIQEDLDNLILQEAKGLMLENVKGAATLDALVAQHKPDVVFIDPISLFTAHDINRLENVTKLVTHLNQIAARRNCSWIIIHHYKKPSKEDTGEPIHKVIGSSGFGNYCESFMGLERAHKQRSGNFKTLYFRLRREEEPEPLHLFRNADSLLYEVVSREEAITSGIKVDDVVRILKEDLKGEASYSVLTSLGKETFGVTKQRIAELLREAKNNALIGKQPGKFGKWYAN